MLPDEINDPIYKGALLQKRQGLLNPIPDISCIHCARKLIFRNNIRQHRCVNVLGFCKGNNLFALCFVFKVVIGCINFIRTFQADNNPIQERLQDFDFPEQLRIIGSTQLILNVFNIVILLLGIVEMDVADQVHDVCDIDPVTLHQFDAEVNVVQNGDNLAVCFLP